MSRWRSRLPSTSSRSVPSRSTAQGSPAATASTASRLKSPVKTPRRTNRARANGLSRSMLHSTVAWIVRWRSGASRPDVTRRESTRSSFTSMADGVRTRMHAAASSIASGTPSSARQMPATSAAFSAVRSNLGSAACARSRNSRTAGASAISANDTSRGSIGRASGSTSKTCSACTRSLARLVTMTVASGSAASSDATSGAAPITCSKLSTTRRSLRPLRASASRSRVGTPMSSCTPSSRATAGSTPPGSRTCSRATNVTRSNRSRASRAASIARRVFPIPPGPTRVTSRWGSSPPSHSSSVPRSVSRPSTSSGGDGRWSAASSARASAVSVGAPRAREASKRSASRTARSASTSSPSSSAVENGLYEVVSSSRMCATSSASRSSRSAGCFT